MEYPDLSITPFQWAFIGLLLILFFIRVFYLKRYNRVYTHIRHLPDEPVDKEKTCPPLSVILVVRDQIEQLQENLPQILTQEYPEYEVIVVNETGSDEVEDALKRLQQSHPHLYHTFIPEGGHYASSRKMALTIGIKAAKHEWLVFTDCNCCPDSPLWLHRMAEEMTPEKDIVIGYSHYTPQKGHYTSHRRFFHFFRQLRYLTSALYSHPYMAYGKNLAYRRSLFFEQNGFSGFLNFEGGDDDLFINRTATASNTALCLYPEAQLSILSYPTPRAHAHEQRIRRIATSYLTGNQPRFWGGESLSRLLFLLATGVFVAHSLIVRQWLLALGGGMLWILHTGCLLWIMKRNARQLEKKTFFLQPLFLTLTSTFDRLASYQRHTR